MRRHRGRHIAHHPRRRLSGLIGVMLMAVMLIAAPITAGATPADGGKVTGGGWFDSAVGAFVDGAGEAIRVDTNPEHGWGFNVDAENVTAADFTSEQASIGSGSIGVEPIDNVPSNAEKFILRYVPAETIDTADFEGFSIDFLIDPSAANTDPNQFYVNVYTITDDPSDTTSWYDCRYDYVATTGSTTSWTALALGPGTAPVAVTDRTVGGNCGATIADMAPGTVLFISVNLGDTSASDTGSGGFFDNASLTVAGSTTTWDFEDGGAVVGRATFGFSAFEDDRGHAQFSFDAGDIHLRSEEYQSVTVDAVASTAKLEGTATVNGESGYAFTVWASDGSPDTFRIRITGPDGPVYDNGDTALGGGNLVVHG